MDLRIRYAFKLLTRIAHTFYNAYGFAPVAAHPERWLERMQSAIYTTTTSA